MNSHMTNIRIKRAYEEPDEGGRNADTRGSALAARPHEGEGESRSLAKGRGAKHGTSKMVCPRSRQVGGVSVALPGGTQKQQGTALALKTRGGERYCHVSLWRQRSAAQRSRDPAETAHERNELRSSQAADLQSDRSNRTCESHRSSRLRDASLSRAATASNSSL